MKLSDFRYNLPPELIGLHPAEDRDGSRMMVLHRKTGQIEHKVFRDILDYFRDGDVMIINNTKVFPARLYGTKEKTGAKIEPAIYQKMLCFFASD
jgi:S-adenosylmethionine:tRNA ribosyltransferase-isomerase